MKQSGRRPLTARLRVPPLLAEDVTFRDFWIGRCASMVGDEVSMVAMPLLGVLTLGLGPAEVGLLTAAGLAPNLLLSLHAGAWVDRHGRRRHAMIVADLGRAVLLAFVAVAGIGGFLTRGELYGAAFLVGALSVVFNLSYASLFVTLVPRDAYIAAGQLLQGARALASVAGPTLGGVLVQVATAPGAMLVDVLSFVGSAAMLRRVEVPETPPAGGPPRDIATGLRFVVRSPLMRPMVGTLAVVSLALGGFPALSLVYIVQSLGFSPGALGLILGAGALGAVAGAALAERLARSFGLGVTITWAIFGLPASMLAIPLVGGPHAVVAAILLAAQFASGFAVLVFDVLNGALTAAAIPPTIRARAQGAFNLVNYGVRPVGAVAVGGLGALVGLRTALLVAVLLGMSGVLVLLASSVPRVRTIDDVARVTGGG
ncbi:MAG: MFS transporter [Conexibacter sp.]